MKRSTTYLDMLMEKQGIKNDLALSRYLGWTNGKISQYRNGKRIMDNEACLAIALELSIDPMEIIRAADMDRAERSGGKSMWELLTIPDKMRQSFSLFLRIENAYKSMVYRAA